MKKLIGVILAAVLCGAAVAAAVYGISQKLLPPKESAESLYTTEYKGMLLSELFSCTGESFEQSKTVHMENAAAIAIKNTSSVNYRYAELTVTAKGEQYKFLATTLLSGAEMTLWEESGKTLDKSLSAESIELTAWECFDTPPSLLTDKLEIHLQENKLSVKNIGQSDISGTLGVYFKLTDGERLFGGITFKSDFSELKKGEEKSISVNISSSYSLVPIFAEIN